MAYATISDLESRWRPLSPSEAERAATLMDDASALLEPYRESASIELLRIVSCNMVRRAMETQGDAFGIDGQISQSDLWAPDLPTGELKLLTRDLRVLRKPRIGSVKMGVL